MKTKYYCSKHGFIRTNFLDNCDCPSNCITQHITLELCDFSEDFVTTNSKEEDYDIVRDYKKIKFYECEDFDLCDLPEIVIDYGRGTILKYNCEIKKFTMGFELCEPMGFEKIPNTNLAIAYGRIQVVIFNYDTFDIVSDIWID